MEEKFNVLLLQLDEDTLATLFQHPNSIEEDSSRKSSLVNSIRFCPLISASGLGECYTKSTDKNTNWAIRVWKDWSDNQQETHPSTSPS